jgi:hypothetical protein
MIRGRRPKPTRIKALTGNPGKRPLNPHEPARIKKLINQVFLDARVASQDVGQEHFGELQFLVKHAHHGGLVQSHDDTMRPSERALVPSDLDR